MFTRLIPAFALLAACQAAPAETLAPAAPAEEAPSWRPVDPENLVLLDMGDDRTIAIELFPEAAPANAASMRNAVRTGFYDGEFFYRVIETHVAQAGKEFDQLLEDVPTVPFEAERAVSAEGFDPLGSPDLYAGEVGHRSGFAVGREGGQEWLLNCPGTIGMARDDDPDSGSVEFYIPLLPRRYLDRNYTVFGRVIAGMDVVNQLARVEPFNEEETAALFGDDAPLAYQMAQYRRSNLDPNMIVSAKIAADLPAANRPAYEVMATPSPEWEALKASKRDYSGIDAFVVTPPKVVDICILPVPVRPMAD
ncbi:MAG: peptidylprolyl isomerase [Hyphomonas sp.]|uniref:peptidylprolyl isomerase n=1 Tax=Hyphomonas sp. TaxID=87 RepID=UPI0035274AAE